MPTLRGSMFRCLALALLAALASCVAPTPAYVKADDPFKQLEANRTDHLHDLTLALVVSENSRIALQHVADTRTKSFIPQPYPEMDPAYLVADLIRVLKSHFKDVRKVDTLVGAGTERRIMATKRFKEA